MLAKLRQEDEELAGKHFQGTTYMCIGTHARLRTHTHIPVHRHIYHMHAYHAHTHTHTYMCKLADTHTHEYACQIHTQRYTCTRAAMWTCHMRARINMHTDTYAEHTRACTHMCTHVHHTRMPHVCTHKYACTHTDVYTCYTHTPFASREHFRAEGKDSSTKT